MKRARPVEPRKTSADDQPRINERVRILEGGWHGATGVVCAISPNGRIWLEVEGQLGIVGFWRDQLERERAQGRLALGV